MDKPSSWEWMTHREQQAWLQGAEKANYVPSAAAVDECLRPPKPWKEEFPPFLTQGAAVANSPDAPVQSQNTKDIAAKGKCPLWLVPPAAELVEARALEHGAAKYGPFNWRDQPIQLSTYLSACKRHLAAFIDGEDVDPESGLIHLAHARATLGIILDAQSHGTLIDDRPVK